MYLHADTQYMVRAMYMYIYNVLWTPCTFMINVHVAWQMKDQNMYVEVSELQLHVSS